jgi:hypothetical protein
VKKPFKCFGIVIFIISIFSLGSPAFADATSDYEPAGIGFQFGVSMQQFQQASFRQGVGNFFRLVITSDENSSYYMHSEQSSFNVEEGDASSNATQNIHGIGASIGLGIGISLDIMVGGATINIPAAASASGGTDAIAAARSTDPVGDIAVKWTKISGRVSLDVGLTYRIHPSGRNVVVTDSGGTASNVNDLGSMNLDVAIKYGF